ncbi:MAG: hypothetical protein ACT4OP_00745 [Actinomycetota bacterium]
MRAPILRPIGVAIATLIIACGDAPLAGVGGGSSEWIGKSTLVSTVTTAASGPSLAPVNRVAWFNADLTPVAGTTPGEIISGVYARARASDPYVQATPAEIAAALPGVEFPSEVPPEVRFVTSQLVYDLSKITLASDQVAAFGLWTVEPYTRSRSVGQQGVFSVANDPEWIAALASGTADTSCARYVDRQANCSVTEIDERPAWELTDELGTTLVWYSDTYRYELFLRSGISTALGHQMASTMRFLGSLAR